VDDLSCEKFQIFRWQRLASSALALSLSRAARLPTLSNFVSDSLDSFDSQHRSQYLYSICDLVQRIGDHASCPALACCLPLFGWKRSEARHEYAHHRGTVRRHRVPVLTGRRKSQRREASTRFCASVRRGRKSPTQSGLPDFGSSKPDNGAAPTFFGGLEPRVIFLESLLQKGLSIAGCCHEGQDSASAGRPDYTAYVEGHAQCYFQVRERLGHIKVVRNV